MKRLVYIDSFSIKSFHQGFNSSSLKMFSEIFDEVTYYATPSSKQQVSNTLNGLPSNVNYKPLFLFPPKGSLGNFIRHLFSSIWNVIILLFVSKKTIVYYNYNSLWGMKIINSIVRIRKVKTIIMCHGELEYLLSGVKLNMLSDRCLHLFVSANFKPAETLFFCVAGRSILNNLERVISHQLLNKFISFEHTFISYEINKDIARTSKIKIGTIGSMGQHKGLDNLLKLGGMLKHIDNVELYTLGLIRCDIKLIAEANIKYIPGSDNGFVAKEILDEYISKMDCIFFMYPIDGYKLTASGALYDAVNSKKIILSLHNDYFDGIFDRVNIGKQFASFDEMADFITQLRFKEIDNNIDYDNNIWLLSPEYEAKRFAENILSM